MPRALGLGTIRILAAIRDGHAFGLDIVARTGMPSGTVYPTLGRLRSRGLIRGRWEDQRVADREGRPRRKYYELTRDGQTALEQATDRVQNVVSELDGLEGAR